MIFLLNFIFYWFKIMFRIGLVYDNILFLKLLFNVYVY